MLRERMMHRHGEAILPLPREGEPSLSVPGLDRPSSSLNPLLLPVAKKKKVLAKIKIPKITRPRLKKLVKVGKPGRKPLIRGEREVRAFGEVHTKHDFIPTQEQREIVETGVANGLFHRDIRRLILNPATGKPIAKDTFREVFKYELKLGHSAQRMALARSVYHQGLGQEAKYDEAGNCIRPAIPPNLAAAKWYEQSRFGLKEGQQIVVTDADGNPLPASGNLNIGQVIFMMPKNGFEAKPMKDITPEIAELPAPEDEDADS